MYSLRERHIRQVKMLIKYLKMDLVCVRVLTYVSLSAF